MRLGRRHRRHERSIIATLALAGGLVTAIVAFAWVALSAPNSLLFRSYYTLHAQFANLSSLSQHNDVRIAGRRVGQVLDPRVIDGTAVADLQLSQSVRPLRSDSRLVVRSQGLLGQRYLEIDPGRHGHPLPNGGWIPASQTSETVQLTDLLNTFDVPRRTQLRTTIDALGEGTLGQGAHLNRAFLEAPATLAGLRSVAEAVLQHTNAAARFFPSLESAVAAANPVREAIATGLEPEAAALAPFASERAELQQALDIAPDTLATTRHGLAETDRLLVALRGFSRAAAAMLHPAPAALEQTRALLAEAPQPLRHAETLLRGFPATVPAVLQLAATATPELPRLENGLRASIPPLRSLGAHTCDFLGWASNWASMLSWGVPGGGPIGPLNVFRLELIGNNQSPGGLAHANGPVYGSDPYPAPCLAGTEKLP
jgi:phospholipid/cholesterol/gamma-HCH transport system substrate-binding protein